jgi:hypothetical protein
MTPDETPSEESPRMDNPLDPPTVHAPPGPPMDTPTDAPASTRRPMRLRTVVFGLVLLAVAGLSLVGALTEIRLSPALVAVAILVGAGFVLVAGGLSAALRESSGRPPV